MLKNIKRIKDYNELFGEHKTLQREQKLQDKYNDLTDRFDGVNAKYEELSKRHDSTRNKREGERVNNSRVNTRLEERLESSNAKVVDLTRRLENSENQLARLEMRSDEKNVVIQNLNNQLVDLRLESGSKENELKNEKQKNQKEVITYYLRPLDNSIVVNDRLIKYVGISSHCDKHFEHSITRELITKWWKGWIPVIFLSVVNNPKKKELFQRLPRKRR